MANKKINWGEELKIAGKVGVRGIGKFFQILRNIKFASVPERRMRKSENPSSAK